jgi:beta-lactamase class D
MYSVSQPGQCREQCWARSSLTVNPIQHEHQFLIIVLEQPLQANRQSIETVHAIILLESLELSGSLETSNEDFGQ